MPTPRGQRGGRPSAVSDENYQENDRAYRFSRMLGASPEKKSDYRRTDKDREQMSRSIHGSVDERDEHEEYETDTDTDTDEQNAELYQGIRNVSSAPSLVGSKTISSLRDRLSAMKKGRQQPPQVLQMLESYDCVVENLLENLMRNKEISHMNHNPHMEEDMVLREQEISELKAEKEKNANEILMNAQRTVELQEEINNLSEEIEERIQITLQQKEEILKLKHENLELKKRYDTLEEENVDTKENYYKVVNQLNHYELENKMGGQVSSKNNDDTLESLETVMKENVELKAENELMKKDIQDIQALIEENENLKSMHKSQTENKSSTSKDNGEIIVLRGELDKRDKEITQLKSITESMKRRENEKTEKVLELEEETSKLKSQVKTMKAEIGNSNESVIKTREVNNAKREEIKKLQNERDSLNEENTYLKSKITTMKNKASKNDLSSAKISDLEDEVTELNGTVDRLREKNAKLKGKLESVERTRNALSDEASNKSEKFKNELEKKEKDLNEFRGEMKRLSRYMEQEMLIIQQDNQRLQDEVLSKATSNSRLETVANDLRSEIIDLKEELHRARMCIEQLENEVKRMSELRNKTSRDKEEISAREGELISEISANQEVIKSLDKSVSSYKNKVSTLKTELAQLTKKMDEEIKEVHNEKETMREDAIQSAKKITNLLEDLDKHKNTISCLEQENNSLHEHLDRSNDLLEKSKTAIDHLESESDSQNGELEKTIKILERKIKKTENEKLSLGKDYEERVETLEKKLIKVNEEKTKLECENKEQLQELDSKSSTSNNEYRGNEVRPEKNNQKGLSVIEEHDLKRKISLLETAKQAAECELGKTKETVLSLEEALAGQTQTVASLRMDIKELSESMEGLLQGNQDEIEQILKESSENARKVIRQEHDVTGLKEKVQSLEALNEILNAEVTQLKDQNDSKSREITNIKSSMDTVRNKLGQVTEENARLENEGVVMKQKLQHTEGLENELNLRLERSNEALSHLEELMKEKDENISEMRGELGDLKCTIQHQEESLKSFRKDKENLIKKIESLTRETTDLTSEKSSILAKYEEQIRSLEESNAFSNMLAKAKEENERQIQSLESSKTEKESELESSKKTIKALEKACMMQKQVASSLRQDVKQLVESMEEQLRCSQDEMKLIQDEADENQRSLARKDWEIQVLKEDINSRELTLSHLNEEISQLRFELQNTNLLVTESKTAIEHLEQESEQMKKCHDEEVRKLMDEKSTSQSKFEDKLASLEKSSREMTSTLQEEIATQKRTVASLCVDVNTLTEEKKKINESLSNKIDENMRELREKQELQDELAEKLGICQNELSISKTDMQGLQNELNEVLMKKRELLAEQQRLQYELADKSKVINSHELEIDGLKEDKKKLKDEITKMKENLDKTNSLYADAELSIKALKLELRSVNDKNKLTANELELKIQALEVSKKALKEDFSLQLDANKNNIASLEKTVSLQTQTITSLRSENGEISRLMDERVNEKQNDLDNMCIEAQASASKVSQQQQQIKELTEEIGTQKKTISHLKDEINQLNKTMNDANIALEETKFSFNCLEKEIKLEAQKHSNQVDDLRNELSKLREDKVELKETIQKAHDDEEELKMILQTKSKSISLLEKKVMYQKQNISIARAEVTRLTDKMEEEMMKSQNEARKYEQEAADKDLIIENLQRKLEIIKKEVESQKTVNSKLKTDAANLRETLLKQKQSIGNTQNTIEQLSKESEEYRRALASAESLRAELSSITQEKNTLDSQLAQEIQSHESLRSTITKLKTKLNSCNGTISMMENKMKMQQENISLLRQENARLVEDIDEQVFSLDGQALGKGEHETQYNDHLIGELKAQVTSHKTMNAKLKENMEELRLELNKTTNSLKEAKWEMQDLERKNIDNVERHEISMEALRMELSNVAAQNSILAADKCQLEMDLRKKSDSVEEAMNSVKVNYESKMKLCEEKMTNMEQSLATERSKCTSLRSELNQLSLDVEGHFLSNQSGVDKIHQENLASKRRLKQQEHDIEYLTKERDASRETCAELQRKLSLCEKELDLINARKELLYLEPSTMLPESNHQQKIKQLENEQKITEMKLNEAEKNLKNSNAKIGSLKNELLVLSQQKNTMEEDKHVLEELLRRQSDDSVQSKNNLTLILNDKSNLKTQIADLKEAKNIAEEKLTESNSKIRVLLEEINILKKQERNFVEDSKSLEISIHPMRDSFNQVKGNTGININDSHDKMAKALEKALMSEREKATLLRSEVTQLALSMEEQLLSSQNDIENIQEELLQGTRTIAQQEREISSLHDKISDHNMKAAQQENEIKTLRSTCHELNVALEKEKNERIATEHNLDQSKARIRELEGTVTSESKKVSVLREDAENLAKNLEKQSTTGVTEISILRDKIFSLEKEKEQVEIELKSNLRDSNKISKILRKELEEKEEIMNSICADAERLTKGMEEQMLASKLEAEKLNERLERLTKRIEDRNRQIEKLSKEIIDYSRSNDELREQVLRLSEGTGRVSKKISPSYDHKTDANINSLLRKISNSDSEGLQFGRSSSRGTPTSIEKEKPIGRRPVRATPKSRQAQTPGRNTTAEKNNFSFDSGERSKKSPPHDRSVSFDRTISSLQTADTNSGKEIEEKRQTRESNIPLTKSSPRSRKMLSSEKNVLTEKNDYAFGSGDKVGNIYSHERNVSFDRTISSLQASDTDSAEQVEHKKKALNTLEAARELFKELYGDDGGTPKSYGSYQL